jgi:gliding motility-associated lipoprotein GldH
MTRWFCLIGILLLGACKGSQNHRADQDFGSGWDAVATFEIPARASQDYDLFLHLRNDNNYPYANIFLIARLRSDSLVLHTDTLEYSMADPTGKWLGTGFAEVKESKLYWRENIRLIDSIPYQIEIEQAQRAQGAVQGYKELPGIVSVGYSLVPKIQ